MQLTFKNATDKDSQAIAALAYKIWHKHYIEIITVEQIDYMLNWMYSEISIKQQMQENQNYILAFDNDILVGYASTSLKSDDSLFIHKLYVDTDTQRAGIGKQLFQHILSSFPLINTISLTVNRKNFKAINFYFKQGFKIKSVEDFDIGNGYQMNDFVMEWLK